MPGYSPWKYAFGISAYLLRDWGSATHKLVLLVFSAGFL